MLTAAPAVFRLRDYQQRIARFICDVPRCAVLVFMGGGKSLSTLTALDRLSLVEDVFPVLVLAPKRVARTTWPDEVRKWAHLQHLKVAVAVGTPEERRAALRSGADIVTMNYDCVQWLMRELDGEWPFRTVVADESTRLKSFRLRQGGKRAQALARVAFKATRWINLTGTFAPNGLKNVWGQMWFLDRGQRLGGSFTAFRDRWFTTGRDGYSIEPMEHAQREVEGRIADVCISLNAADYLDLPPLIETVVPVELPPAVRRTYRALERELFVTLKSGHVRADMALTRTGKCLQLTAGALYLTDDEPVRGPARYEVLHEEKLDALESIIEEAGGAPILVAYHFKFELEQLRKRFGKRVRHLDANPRTIADWNAGRIEILAAHPASAGHGLNLQDGGHIMVFLTSWWNLEEHQQIIERIGPARQAQAGHNRPVFIYRIVAAGTLDEDVLERLQGKADVQTALLKALERRNG